MKAKYYFYTLLIIHVSFPKIASAQTPDLGTAANFGLFTTSGAFENYGETNVKGDIGTNVGAFSGFPPGTLNGEIHVADPTSVQAGIDTETAYSYLDGLSCGQTITTTLGNGQILLPNTYCTTAATQINGNLIFDGGGDSNSLFIVKINGTLSTAGLSIVSLINGASFKNIYWQVNGSVELGDHSIFRGTILSNGAINILEGATLYGRGLSANGAISAHTNLIDIISDNVALPIGLLTFDAKLVSEKVVLNWSSASETNNDYYTIDRSLNNLEWEKIGLINGAGSSTETNFYSFTDPSARKEILYYRLKQTDFDGKFNYFDIISLNNTIESSDIITIYPNPSIGPITISYKDQENIACPVSVYTSSGLKIFSSDDKTNYIDFSERENGFYYLELIINSEKVIRKFEILKM